MKTQVGISQAVNLQNSFRQQSLGPQDITQQIQSMRMADQV